MILSPNPHHKFVKTTPKPNATKNNKGELVGPLDGVEVWDTIIGVVVVDDVCEIGVGTPLRVVVCVPPAARS